MPKPDLTPQDRAFIKDHNVWELEVLLMGELAHIAEIKDDNRLLDPIGLLRMELDWLQRRKPEKRPTSALVIYLTQNRAEGRYEVGFALSNLGLSEAVGLAEVFKIKLAKEMNP